MSWLRSVRSVRFIVFAAMMVVVVASQAFVVIGSQAQAERALLAEQERSLDAELMLLDREWLEFAVGAIDRADAVTADPTLAAATATGDPATVAAWFSRADLAQMPIDAEVSSRDGDILWENGAVRHLLAYADLRGLRAEALESATGNIFPGPNGRPVFVAASPLGSPRLSPGALFLALDVDSAFIATVQPFLSTRMSIVDAGPSAVGDPEADAGAPSVNANGTTAEGNDRGRLSRLYPLADGTDSPRYAIRLVPDTDQAELIATSFFRNALWVGLVTLAISILVASALARFVTARLAELSGSLRRIAAGAYDTPVERTGLAELDPIADAVTDLQAALRDTKRDLVAAERLALIGRMAGGIAHDVRTPLMSIVMATDMLGAGVDPSTASGLATRIRRQTGEIESLMGDLTEFARGRRGVKLEGVGLASFLQEIAHGWEPAFQARRARLDVTCSASTAWRLDRNRLRRALDNFIKNGLEALDGPGTVEVAAQVDASEGLVISVRDTGTGIPEAMAGKLFTPFETTKLRGTGLGLSICATVVQDHGGYIDFDTSPQGTAFHLRFPPQPEA